MQAEETRGEKRRDKELCCEEGGSMWFLFLVLCLRLNVTPSTLSCASASFLIYLFHSHLSQISKQFLWCESITNPPFNFGESKEIQKGATSVFEVARPKGLAQEVVTDA